MNILNCLTLFIFKIFIRPRLCYVEHRQYNTYLIPTYNTYSVFFAPHLYCLLVSTTACILYCISDNEPSRPCATINTHVMYTRKSKTEKNIKRNCVVRDRYGVRPYSGVNYPISGRRRWR